MSKIITNGSIEFYIEFEIFVEEVKDLILGVQISVQESELIRHACISFDHQPIDFLHMGVFGLISIQRIYNSLFAHKQNFEDLVRCLCEKLYVSLLHKSVKYLVRVVEVVRDIVRGTAFDLLVAPLTLAQNG